MRKIVSLYAALMAISNAQFHTIDSIVVVQSANVPSNHQDQNNSLSDYYVGHDNGSYNPDKKDDTRHLYQTDARAESDDLVENEGDNDVMNIIRNLSDANAFSSRERRQASESKSHKEVQNTNKSNELPKSNIPPNSHDESLPRCENRLTQIRSSEDTSEKSESQDPESGENPRSVEPESGKPPESSEEAVSKNPVSEESATENPASEESPEVHLPIGVSGEEDRASGQDNTEGVEEQVVQTTHGPVRGYSWSDNTDIMAFYDIPYGKFSMPFETPTTAQSWLVHEATQHTKACPQLQNDEYIGDMNCLTLSIFTPKVVENASVVFHIYDSYANCTSADPLIYGPDYLVPKGVILVLPNFRIGPMGFLCLQNETALGNAGLKDLSLALEWVKNNIHLFGGNPSNIVVTGDGAAGAYAGYLAICSRSKYYIHKVITESGSALSHWALDRNPINTAYMLAEKIKIENSDGVVFNNTFAEVDLETILRAAKGMRFEPCIEYDKEPFIDNTPWKILQNKEIDTTFMIGSASYAGTHEAMDTTAEFIAQINEHFDLLLPEDLVFKNDDEKNDIAFKLRKQYFGEDNITVSDIEELALWYTDASYLSPGIRLARPLLSAGATVYLYEFAFVGSLNGQLEALHKPVSGAVRGDLANYLFYKGGTSVEEGSSEKRMIEMMVDIWVSFINSGKPETANVVWNELKKAEEEEEEWLVISSEPELKKGVHVERLRLWTSLYDQHFIENNDGQTYSTPHLALAAAIICLIANNKLNYSRH